MNVRRSIALAAWTILLGVPHASAFTLDFSTLGPQYTSFGTNIPLQVSAPGGETISFSASGSQFETYRQGSSLADNQFANGTSVLSEGFTNSPVTIAFSSPIDSLNFAASSLRYGTFSALLNVYSGSSLISTTTFYSDLEQGKSGPTPIFSAFAPGITSATLSIDSSNSFGGSALIGPVSYTLSPVPLPATLPMFGAALAVLGACGYWTARRQKAVEGIALLPS